MEYLIYGRFSSETSETYRENSKEAENGRQIQMQPSHKFQIEFFKKKNLVDLFSTEFFEDFLNGFREIFWGGSAKILFHFFYMYLEFWQLFRGK